MMNPRIRKAVGALAMLTFVVVYAFVAMALADSRPVNEAPALVRTFVYMVLGLAWVLPMMPLIVWMERGRLTRR
jgi:predicted membrane channel-forming protein YqfA (hemolysin III family)